MRSAETVLAHALALAPTLGPGRLISIDGPAGSGKTTLAAALEALAPSSRVIHLDDLYDGWTGLPRVCDQLDSVLLPLASGAPGSYRRYDWAATAYAETVPVHPVPLLILEGVGSGSLAHSSLITTLVWVSAPAPLRLSRGLLRDGLDAGSLWTTWMFDEAAHHLRERTRERASVLVDGTGATPAQVVAPST